MIGEIRQNFTEASASVGPILATALPSLRLQNLNIKEKTKRILVVVVK